MSRRAHGPLPVLLVGLTVVTGLVDAFSYLSLAHVFVANMTGNVVFLGFGLAGVGDIAIVASLVAILAFTLGDRRPAAGRRYVGRRTGVTCWPPPRRRRRDLSLRRPSLRRPPGCEAQRRDWPWLVC
jgi:uncharacterized membrane protein YoaK (UPF0700 family)